MKGSNMDHEAKVQVLYKECKNFPLRLKKAMFAAASHQMIRRGTWDGCAYNAAGMIIDQHVKSLGSAAKAFKIPESMVSRFIEEWDLLPGTTEEANLALREALEKADLFNEPSRVKRVVRRRVFTSQATKDKEAFEEMVKDLDFSESSELVEDTLQVAEMFAAKG